MIHDDHLNKKFFHILSWIFIAIAFLWMAWQIYNDKHLIFSNLIGVKFKIILFILSLGFISSISNALIFHFILQKQCKTSIRFLKSASLFFVGQLIKHLPGRIWSIAYQITETKNVISASTMIRANIDFMFIVVSFSIIVSLSILSGFVTLWLALLTFFGGYIIFVISLRYDWNRRILKLILLLMPTKFAHMIKELANTEPYSWTEIIRVSCYSALVWIFYLLAWRAIPLGWEVFAEHNMIQLCAKYAIAWLVGFISLFTPSGLGVREASFIVFTSDISVSIIALLAIIIRLWLSVSDIILGIFFMALTFLITDEVI